MSPYLILLNNCTSYNCPLVNETLVRLGLSKLNTQSNYLFLNLIEYCFSLEKNVSKGYSEDLIKHKINMKFHSIRESHIY